MKRIITIFVFLLLFIPVISQASTLYLEVGASEYGPGDTFAADIYVDIGEECINTIASTLEYPSDYLSVIDFIEGESIINLWVDKPDKKKIQEGNTIGVLNFAGGTPGGYCGRVPGDPGRSNLVAKVIFGVPGLIISDTERETVRIDFNQEKTKVLLNDGFGTEDELALVGFEYKVGKNATQKTKEWKDQINKDEIKPEPFIVELRRDKDMFDNRFYIIFHTVDKQSGIDHFEVLETRNDKESGVVEKRSFFERFFTRLSSEAEWKPATMPYVLEDQDLNSVIRVKAIDKAGNERFVEYIPPAEFRMKAQMSLTKILAIILAVVGVVIVILVFIIIYIKKRKKHDQDNNEI